MITKVELKNFQSHAYTVIDLVDGVNVIIGPSDAGKSAVFRAINWVVSNRPLGDAYRSEWGGDTSVTLTTADGRVITRLRTDKQNAYVIDGVTLTAFGSEPPDAVFEALAIDPCNVQSQADPPFLLAASAGEVAAALNRAASIDDIDRAMGGLRRGAAALNRDLTYNRAQRDEYKEQLKAYDHLPATEALVAAAEAALTDLTTVSSDYATFKALVDRIHSVKGALAATQHFAGAEEQLALALTAQTEYYPLNDRRNRLGRIIRAAQAARAAVARTDGVAAAGPTLAQADEAANLLRVTYAQRAGLRRLLRQVRAARTEVTQAGAAVLALEVEYEELAPDNCPFCGKPMNEGSHDE